MAFLLQSGTATSSLISIGSLFLLARASFTTVAKKQFKTGAIVGKFYPPHLGHSYLIETGASQCESLTVIVCWKADEKPTGQQRGDWIKAMHPSVSVLIEEDVYGDAGNSKLWAELTRKFLGYYPNAVFTSENYGEAWAQHLGAVHKQVDQKRNHFAVSGTMIRTNPYEYFHMMHPSVRQYYSKVVCVVGAESTGKTVLTNRLTFHYFGTAALVTEYGREVTDRNLANRPVQKQGDGFRTPEWRSEDFVEIATVQSERIQQACESAPLVVADTDAVATAIWHERYMGYMADKSIILRPQREMDLYLLCETAGAPFVQDGTRDGDEDGKREWMNGEFLRRLGGKENVVILKGNFEDRFLQAIKAIDARFPQFAAAI